MDKAGTLYIADTGAHAIRVIRNGTGEVRVLAGNGSAGTENSAVGTLARFADALRPAEALAARRSFTAGTAMGASFFTLFASYALVFWAGGQFVANGWLNFQDLLQAFFAIVMAAQGAGQTTALTTERTASAPAARRSPAT